MRRIRRTCCALLALLGCSRDVPLPAPPKHWCNDRVEFLTESVRAAIDAKLERHEQISGQQVVVWIDERLPPGMSIEVYSLLVFNAWGVGQKRLDNGVALFMFVQDHKLRIQTGYGMETKLSDSECGRIIRDVMVPNLQAGNNNSAVVDGVAAVLAALEAE